MSCTDRAVDRVLTRAGRIVDSNATSLGALTPRQAHSVARANACELHRGLPACHVCPHLRPWQDAMATRPGHFSRGQNLTKTTLSPGTTGVRWGSRRSSRCSWVAGCWQYSGESRPTTGPKCWIALTNAVFWLAASMIGACGTIAALMLTTVGLLEHLETERLTPRFLFHLRLIVTSALATIALAVLALLLTVFPTSGAGDVSPNAGLLAVVYWSLLVVTALMIGGFATVLGGLYTTIGEFSAPCRVTGSREILTDSGETSEEE